jgi:hypothetical protein
MRSKCDGGLQQVFLQQLRLLLVGQHLKYKLFAYPGL